jgi:isopenicillin-N N-acyltransferase like protein
MVPVRMSGDAYRIGGMHGEAFRSEIHAFLSDDLCRLNRLLSRPTSLVALRPAIDRYRRAIVDDAPDLADEVRGLAAGARIGLDEAVLLQIRREVLGYHRIPTMGDCTTLFSRRNGQPVLAQTIDLNGNLDDVMTVLHVTHQGGRRVLLLSFVGLLGYLGINSDGLAIGLNLVLGGEWTAGLPPYLAIRHLLDTCASVEACLDRLAGLHLASSRALTICDHDDAVTLEVMDGKIAVRRGAEMVHTNHFLAEPFIAADAINPFARNSSLRRLAACEERLAQLPKHPSCADYMDILVREPIRVRDTGDIRRERTVGAVVLSPRDRAIHVRRGDPAQARTHTFHVDG